MNRRLTGLLGAFRWEWGMALSSVLWCWGCSAGDGGDRARGTAILHLWGDEGGIAREVDCHGLGKLETSANPEERALATTLALFCSQNPQASVALSRVPNQESQSEYLEELNEKCGQKTQQELLTCLEEEDAPEIIQGQPEELSPYAPCDESRPGLKLLPISSDVLDEVLGFRAFNVPHERNPELVALDPYGEVVQKPYLWFTRHMSCPSGDAPAWLVPMRVHHVNRVFYNRERVIAVFGADFEAKLAKMTLDEWLAEGRNLPRESGGPAFIAMPNTEKDAWVLSMLALENVRVALTKGFAHLREGTTHEQMAHEVRLRLGTLRELALGDEMTADEAFDRVKNGEALFTVIGDWKRPELTDSPLSMAWFPGTQNVRAYAVDGYSFLDQRGNGNMSNLQEAFMSNANKAKADFAKAKGATEVSSWMSDELGDCARWAIANGNAGCYAIPALSLQNDPWTEDVGLPILTWWRNPGSAADFAVERVLVPPPGTPLPVPPAPPSSPEPQ